MILQKVMISVETDGRPVEGAEVKTRKAGGDVVCRTGKAGLANLQLVPGDVYRVEVTAEGYAPWGHNVLTPHGGGGLAVDLRELAADGG